MRKITYGLFIYICLATVEGKIPAPNSNLKTDTKSKCESTADEVIHKYLASIPSKTVKNCNYTGEDLSVLDFRTIDPYLCIAIFNTRNITCKLNSSLTLTEADFKPQMKVINNQTRLISEMNKILSNSSYKEAINVTNYPYLSKVNDQFRQQSEFVCNSMLEPHHNPLCNVLLWMNKVLVDTKISMVKAQKPKPEGKSESSKSNASDDSKKQQNVTQSSANNTAVQNVNETRGDFPVERQLKNQLGDKENLGKSGNSPQNDEGADDIAQTSQNEDTQSSDAGMNDKRKLVTKTITEAKIREQEESPAPSGVEENSNNEKKDEPGNETTAKEKNKQSEHSPEPDDVGTSGKNRKENSKTDDKVPTKGSTQTHTKSTPKTEDKSLPTSDLDKNDEKVEEAQDSHIQPIKNEDEINQNQHSRYPESSDPEPPQHFFAYFMAVSLICLICYVGYHKKHKIMGIIFEGRKSRGGRARRRPNTAGYRKLDCTLEEAVTSQCNSNVTHVIY